MRALLLSLLFASAAFGQAGTLEGTVRDAATGEVLPGANVSIVGTTRGAVTGLDGRFAIRDVPTGTHAVRVAVAGFNAFDATLTIDGETTFEVELHVDPRILEISTGDSYMPLVPLSPFASRVWSREEIQRLPVR